MEDHTHAMTADSDQGTRPPTAVDCVSYIVAATHSRQRQPAAYRHLLEMGGYRYSVFGNHSENLVYWPVNRLTAMKNSKDHKRVTYF